MCRARAVLEPAGQALQLNLLGVRDEEVRVVEERRWTHDVLELGVRPRGPLTPCANTADAWCLTDAEQVRGAGVA